MRRVHYLAASLAAVTLAGAVRIFAAGYSEQAIEINMSSTLTNVLGVSQHPSIRQTVTNEQAITLEMRTVNVAHAIVADLFTNAQSSITNLNDGKPLDQGTATQYSNYLALGKLVRRVPLPAGSISTPSAVTKDGDEPPPPPPAPPQDMIILRRGAIDVDVTPYFQGSYSNNFGVSDAVTSSQVVTTTAPPTTNQTSKVGIYRLLLSTRAIQFSNFVGFGTASRHAVAGRDPDSGSRVTGLVESVTVQGFGYCGIDTNTNGFDFSNIPVGVAHGSFTVGAPVFRGISTN